MAEQVPRVRQIGIPNDALLVVRGDELNAEILRADAQRFRRRFDAWDRFGVSALVATDDAEVLALCESRLERFPLVVGEGNVRAVAQVVEVDSDIVRVRPLPGPVSKHHALLGGRVA